MTSKNFPLSVSLVKRFENRKPPVVPYSMQLIADDIIYRAATNVINPNPNSLKSLFEHSIRTIDNNRDTLQYFLSLIMNEKKPNNEAYKHIMRLSVTGKFRNEVVLASLLEFFNRCQEGIHVTMTYPIDGWIMLGAVTKEFKDDDTRFARELDAFLREYAENNGVHKDFFCFIMQMLTSLVQTSIDNCKPNLDKPTLTAYLISRFFGPKIIRVQCVYCNSIITTMHSTHCDKCREILQLSKFPLPIKIVMNILSNIPVIFWNNSMNNPRPGVLIRRNGELIRRNIMMAVYDNIPSQQPQQRFQKKRSIPTADKSYSGNRAMKGYGSQQHHQINQQQPYMNKQQIMPPSYQQYRPHPQQHQEPPVQPQKHQAPPVHPQQPHHHSQPKQIQPTTSYQYPHHQTQHTQLTSTMHPTQTSTIQPPHQSQRPHSSLKKSNQMQRKHDGNDRRNSVNINETKTMMMKHVARK